MNRIKGSSEYAYLCDEITRGLNEERGRARSSKFRRRRDQRRLVMLGGGELLPLRECGVTSTWANSIELFQAITSPISDPREVS